MSEVEGGNGHLLAQDIIGDYSSTAPQYQSNTFYILSYFILLTVYILSYFSLSYFIHTFT